MIISLGFDTFHRDPLGSFDLTAKDYAVIAGRIQSRRKAGLHGVKTLILLEGGYVLDVTHTDKEDEEGIGACCVEYLKGWERGEQPNA